MMLFIQQQKQATHYQKESCPNYADLQQGLSIKNMMILTGKSYNNKTEKNFVEVVSQDIYHFIKRTTSKNATNGRFYPQTRMATDTCNKVCGLAILDSVLSWAITKLGANIDTSSTIEQLSINMTESLATFVLR
jgi:hypothetical protein